MNRIKHHKIKQEMPETSSTRTNDEQHDLAYYIHDRVELMHQVFSIIKPKELKAMAPECVQDISIDDLQELCTEELLGISSKRLCAILDGADPPTDTESSSSEPLETISLDSISSDEEILSQPCAKTKKHKHRKHKSKGKHKRKNSDSSNKDQEIEDRSKASRAGLTVLELLELQARARAIRAQLQQDNSNKQETVPEKHDSSDEVEIKEEPPEVVEISSEDEKPKAESLTAKPSSPSINTTGSVENSASVKRINNLVITVPQTKPSRKIKLNRTKLVRISTNSDVVDKEKEKNYTNNVCNQTAVPKPPVETLSVQISNKEGPKPEQSKIQGKLKKKQKKKSKKNEKDGSDHDEIMLQLSDTEKMDLLENFNREDYDNFTSSSSKDSESSSEDESVKDVPNKEIDKNTADGTKIAESLLDTTKTSENHEISDDINVKEMNHSIEIQEQEVQTNNVAKNIEQKESPQKSNANDIDENVLVLSNKDNLTNDCNTEETTQVMKNGEMDTAVTQKNEENKDENINSVNVQENNNEEQLEEGEILSKTEEVKEDLSDGEIPNKTCAEMESHDASSKVVYISDEETANASKTTKNKKKEKKSKKQKKSKKKDFRESGDQNFLENNEYKKNLEPDKINVDQHRTVTTNDDKSVNVLTIDDDDDIDDIFEILELSDDSSHSEIEGDSVLSKEPTTAEIAALSAKIDEIHNEDIVTKEKELIEDLNEEENISWRDRYLDSKKVKRVLTTSNILNALRKKNKDIKRMLEATKNITEDVSPKACESDVVVEGSIEHFNTLEASTKYVDPIADIEEKQQVEGNSDNTIVSKEMEKNAKLLLKMYKKLLKYNDINKQKDPNKKKKKKQKKNKDKDKEKSVGIVS
ncbi:glutamic acid-rich protein [Vanessa cardui]|uniref:glutamic acid-rich protein n=1 Tax=Vanessa cardui TaxID=171605 RepID=UPI001F134D86|nr:glutamic acid-rich protein [Vanessa cardui]